MYTFSSKAPERPPTVMAASLPMTWADTWVRTSAITGLTLPGMIEEPLRSSGRYSSASPARGPDPIQRISLAILVQLTATVLRAPDSSTRASRAPWASNGWAGGDSSRPVAAATRSRTLAANSGWALRPVPTAVPPSGSLRTRTRAASTRAAPSRISADLASSDPARASRAGSRSLAAASRAARWTAVGKVSLEDWPMLTWSLGWWPSPARVAMTSLTLVLVLVPDPVWKTSIGNWSSWSPAATASAAATIRSARPASSRPRSALTRAASALTRASIRTTSTGTRSPEMRKCSIAFSVSPCHSCAIALSLLPGRSDGCYPLMDPAPMWTCPRCGRSFANRNQSHACGPLDLDRHLAGKDPEVVAIFRRLVELAEANGPVTVLAEKTRIAFQVRMSFAAFTLRRRWVDGHVVLARRLEHPG